MLGLGEKIDGTQGEGLESGVAALFRMSAEENDRQRSALHDQAKRFHPVHARHFQIKSHDIRLKFLNFFQSERAVHGGANNFDGRFARKDSGNQFPHKGGIIDNENAYAFVPTTPPTATKPNRPKSSPPTFT